MPGLRRGSKLSTLTWWDDTTLGADLGVADAGTDENYAAMDWLEHRQDAIEAELARRHLAPQPNPSRMAVFDLFSSWLEGSQCPLAARGYSRDGEKGKLQIEYGLLTDPEGRPVAVRVFPGSTGDPAAFTAIADVVRKKFKLAQMVMVGDRGMITSARIQALNQPHGHPQAGPDRRRSRPGRVLRAAHPRPRRRDGRGRRGHRLQEPQIRRTGLPAHQIRRPGPRPVFHRLEERVKAHVLICVLACYLTCHLRRTWAPLTFTDQDPPAPDNPVAPARRSAAAQAKASYQDDPAGQPCRSFRSLLEHLATLTRNQVRFAGTTATVPMLAEPTSTQRQAFQLLGAAIPLTLK